MTVTSSWGRAPATWSVLVHGGAGDVPMAKRAEHIEGCRLAAAAGAEILAAGGSALDAVQRAVEVLESDPRFNAGVGACLTEAGTIELDAAIMEGTHLGAGGVCALPPFLHPVAIARAILDEGEHVLYAGTGAARFAEAHGFTPSTDTAMITENSRVKWEIARMRAERPSWAGGTVGAVARDASGHTAAATSTGGRVNKRLGRVGDSPIPGAGNYADDEAGACSNTGDGEAVLRVCLAKTAIEWMRAGASAEEAAQRAVVHLGRIDGRGGIILVDREGRLGLARSTATMTWAAATAGGSDAATSVAPAWEIEAGC
ncbi:MAG: L-asparaginase [Myxococcaceae bacterium]|nr:L-asparaginase [Myxococcaceae bacterium]